MSHDEEMDMAMSRIGVLRYQLEQANDEIARLRSSSFVTAVPSDEYEKVKTELANLKAERDQLKADLEKSDGVVWTLSVENDRLKQSLRLQIEQNALAQVGFKMYQDNVDSGGLHKDRKDAIARLEAENARLKAEVERLTKAGDAMMGWIDHQHDDSGYQHSEAWEAAKGVQP
jgi:cell division protein FtsB